MKNAYTIIRNPEGKEPLGKRWCRWVDNIRMDCE
jgi:hypothetical protein